jgi:hypothetical protein
MQQQVKVGNRGDAMAAQISQQRKFSQQMAAMQNNNKYSNY